MSMLEFAKSELKRLEDNCGDDEEALKMQKLITADVLQILNTFVEQQHSGFSAGYMLNILDRLLRYKPLTPLTGADDEWEDCSQYGMQDMQNKRCTSVFKRPDGTAYWVEGKIFSEDGGKSWYTSKDSHIDIEFPFDVPMYSENVYVEPSEEDIKKEEETSNEEK